MSLLLCVSTRSANYASLVTAQLIVMASHMVVFLLSFFNLEFSLLALFIFTHLSNYLYGAPHIYMYVRGKLYVVQRTMVKL